MGGSVRFKKAQEGQKRKAKMGGRTKSNRFSEVFREIEILGIVKDS